MRGFATWTPEKRREVSSKGGRAAHVKKTAHEFNSAEAKAAGAKGGRATAMKRLEVRRQEAAVFDGDSGEYFDKEES